ncbi:hypothetical protein DEO72_LG8g1636 [Vigna unguiculata]|uniref:Uncharacterized protein n=1 Tax=Vigna unguiculata TaxID=3917 RepID=A0A4D6MSJ8_VIGUN|nr:hypothetical protein DEO72_LG8g1636 [Vigna unguiculata]
MVKAKFEAAVIEAELSAPMEVRTKLKMTGPNFEVPEMKSSKELRKKEEMVKAKFEAAVIEAELSALPIFHISRIIKLKERELEHLLQSS